MNGRLLQLSGVVVDLVHHIGRLPAAGEEVETSQFCITAGGGFNAMAAARRMGATVTYGGVLGTGPLAELAIKALSAEGIDVPEAARAGIDQGSCAVLVDATGERSFITHHGAEREVSFAHLDSLDASSCSFALFTGYSLYKPKSAAAFLSWLPLLPRPPLVFFDPGPTVGFIPRDTLDAAMARADWVSANAQEAGIVTGEDDPAKAALRLADGRQGALVRSGAAGCWLAQDSAVQHIASFPVDAIDTNGAGDTHDGVFIASLVAGFSPKDSALVANAAAALSTTKIGPATSPDLDETRNFLDARGVKLPAPEVWRRVQPGAGTAHQEEDRK
jgi:sugar/nucleoside kinase (ribokinase family)